MTEAGVIRMATCKKCNASIVWTKTPNGKWMCADEGLVPYKQIPKGPDTVITDRGETIRCKILVEEDCRAGKVCPTGLARIPHWATCPYADEFRRRERNSA